MLQDCKALNLQAKSANYTGKKQKNSFLFSICRFLLFKVQSITYLSKHFFIQVFIPCFYQVSSVAVMMLCNRKVTWVLMYILYVWMIVKCPFMISVLHITSTLNWAIKCVFFILFIFLTTTRYTCLFINFIHFCSCKKYIFTVRGQR